MQLLYCLRLRMRCQTLAGDRCPGTLHGVLVSKKIEGARPRG
jgi:hypothetical protein